MFVFAIETCGKTVAFTKETDRIMLDGILSGDRDEGKHIRAAIESSGQWDGVSPFTARLATESEELDYGITTHEAGITDDESTVVFQLKDTKGLSLLLAAPRSQQAA